MAVERTRRYGNDAWPSLLFSRSPTETVRKVGDAIGPPGRCSREFWMKWRVMLELVGPDGTVCVHEVGGRVAVAEYAPQMIGLTLEEGKHLLAALQV